MNPSLPIKSRLVALALTVAALWPLAAWAHKSAEWQPVDCPFHAGFHFT